MAETIDNFQATVWNYYARHGRDLPWRQALPDGSYSPYYIMLSEIMLQQTQVKRVIVKYHEFLVAFPSLADLAAAPLADVLQHWSGLGYNRRAKYLHDAARQLAILPEFPRQASALRALPGIGPNTAAAILAYAFNAPTVFIETNIRSVFIAHFFPGEATVSDKAIFQKVSQTLSLDEPREWYWALMDYGSFLKQTAGNHARASHGYKKQSKFEGSLRQVRGAVLKILVVAPTSETDLSNLIDDDRLPAVLAQLAQERLINKQANLYRLGS